MTQENSTLLTRVGFDRGREHSVGLVDFELFFDRIEITNLLETKLKSNQNIYKSNLTEPIYFSKLFPVSRSIRPNTPICLFLVMYLQAYNLLGFLSPSHDGIDSSEDNIT